MSNNTDQLDRLYPGWRTRPPTEAIPLGSFGAITSTTLTNAVAIDQVIPLCMVEVGENEVFVLKKGGVKGTGYYTNVGSVPLEFQPYNIPTTAFIDSISFVIRVSSLAQLTLVSSRFTTEPELTNLSACRIFDLFDFDDLAPMVVEGKSRVEILLTKLIGSFAPGTGVPPLGYPVPAGGFLLEGRLSGYKLRAPQINLHAFPMAGAK